MLRFGTCFKCVRCSCIACDGEERDIEGEKPAASSSSFIPVQTRTTWTETYDKMANIDIHPSAEFAASLSFHANPIVDSQSTVEEIQYAYHKLRNVTSDPLLGITPPSSVCTRYSHNEDMGSQHWSPCSTSIPGGYDHPRSVGTYITPNKIAYRGPFSSGLNTPNVTNPQVAPCLTTVRELLQKTSAKKTATKPGEFAAVEPSTGRLMNKLRNLDEILRNLDDSLLARKFSSKLASPKSDYVHLGSNLGKFSDRYTPSTAAAPGVEPTKSVRLCPADGLDCASGPCPVTSIISPAMSSEATSSILKMKPSLTSKSAVTLEMDNNWPESGSSGSTHGPQSFSTPIATRVKEDIPLLLSKYASVTHHNPLVSYVDDSAMRELVSRLVFLEEQMVLGMRCLRSGTRRRKRCRVRPGKKVLVVILHKQLLSTFQQRLARSDAAVRAMKNQIRQVLEQINHKLQIATAEQLPSPLKLKESQDSGCTTESIKDSANLIKSVKSLEEKYTALSANNQQLTQGAEAVEKQCREHRMELELCWAAINQLCIDNELFRNELRQQRGSPTPTA